MSRQYNRQYGTMARLRGMGDWGDPPGSDLVTEPPGTPVSSDGGPLAQSSDGTWIDRAFDIAEKALTLDQIRNLQKVNLDRVRRGLSPLDPSVYRQVQPGVNVGISPAMDKFVWIGLGIAGIFVLMQLTGSRRS